MASISFALAFAALSGVVFWKNCSTFDCMAVRSCDCCCCFDCHRDMYEEEEELSLLLPSINGGTGSGRSDWNRYDAH